MTEKEIIKALEVCWIKDEACGSKEDCPYYGLEKCIQNSVEDGIDLIKRQQERMDEVVKSLESQIDGYREYYPDDYIFETYDMIDLCESIIEMIKGDANDR